jgi:hypothetical protein
MEFKLPELSGNDIASKTNAIYADFLRESLKGQTGNFTVIKDSDLRTLFQMYDRSFFGGFFTIEYVKKLKFAFSNKMTKTGGKLQVSRDKKNYKIVLSIYLLYKSFNQDTREIIINGLVCKDRLEAAMRILEHEIVHLIEYVLYGDSSCSKPRFRTLSKRLFNHTGVTHRLITQDEIAHTNFDLHIGDTVIFEVEDDTLTGIIYRINKRATVMVKHKKGDYFDTKGTRYKKYYVPLQSMRKCR